MKLLYFSDLCINLLFFLSNTIMFVEVQALVWFQEFLYLENRPKFLKLFQDHAKVNKRNGKRMKESLGHSCIRKNCKTSGTFLLNLWFTPWLPDAIEFGLVLNADFWLSSLELQRFPLASELQISELPVLLTQQICPVCIPWITECLKQKE